MVIELEAAGIPSTDISLLANRYASAKYVDRDETSNTATGAGLGAVVGAGAELLAGLGMLAIPGVGPIVAAGWLAAAVAGAVAGGGAGGIVGPLVDAGVPEEHVHVNSEAIRRGGTLLSVKADSAHAQRAKNILDRNEPLDSVNLGADYRKSGWKSYKPDAPFYELTEAEGKSLGA